MSTKQNLKNNKRKRCSIRWRKTITVIKRNSVKCQVKLHIEDRSIRPIVSFIWAPGTDQLKQLVLFLKKIMNLKKPLILMHDTNRKLTNEEFDTNIKLVMIDVKYVYTNKIIKFIKENRMKNY